MNPPSTRIVAQPSHGQWDAWFEDAPQNSFGGDTAATAVLRLLASAGLSPNEIEADSDGSHSDRQVFRVKQRQKCPDCKGSGKYVGLSAVEPCGTCGGSGCVVPTHFP